MTSYDKLSAIVICSILAAVICGAGLDAYVRTHGPCACVEVKP